MYLGWAVCHPPPTLPPLLGGEEEVTEVEADPSRVPTSLLAGLIDMAEVGDVGG